MRCKLLRYEDDIHYKGGTLLNENLGWAATMLAYSSRPPDPKIVGAKWKKMWMERLENEPFLLIDWLKHPHRDAYWKHGSVCEDWSKIQIPVMCVGGWNDAYSNAIPRLMRNLRGQKKAIIGPWAHKYPHFAVPGPQIGFLQEMVRWWDQHLKDQNTGIMLEPDFRYYMMDAYRPGAFPKEIDGRWIGDAMWGMGNTATKTWHLTDKGIAAAKGSSETALTLRSKQTTGFDGGEYCIIWLGPDFPGEQSRDDSDSIVFDSPVLTEDMDIAGQPMLELDFAVDKPVAHIAVRLNDVWPEGAVTRITYHLQNLCMRTSRDTPTALEPGKRYKVKIKMDDIAWRVPKGHRLRVSISTTYFPMMWPAPEPVTLTLYAGASELQLPIRKVPPQEKTVTWQEPEAAVAADVKELKKPLHTRVITDDPATGGRRLEIVDDFGMQEIKPHGLTVWSAGRENYAIQPDDPSSAVMETHWTEGLKRGKWEVRTETYGRLTASPTVWKVWGKIVAFEGKREVFSREFSEDIPRKLM
jgi:uncharacterized protein